MGLNAARFFKNLFVKDKNGDSSYFLDAKANWGLNGSNLYIAKNHPILTPALLFVSKLYSQAEFNIINKKTGKIINEHWLLNLLNNPNRYQTLMDLLESLMFMQIATGKAVLWKKGSIGFDKGKNIDNLFLLNTELIEYPNDFKTKITNKKFSNEYIIYDKDGINEKIKIKNLLFFYDLPNCLQDNFLENNSRLDGLKQTLINTHDSLIAKNIILKTNGKEMLSSANGKEGFPLSNDDKERAENIFNNNLGLSFLRKRGFITNASVTWKSLHIALRDLGLDESVKVDGNLIYTALHIPKDILSLEAKKTTYNNFKESMVSYIQNEMQSSLDATALVLNKLLIENNEEHLKIVGDYKHLPVMQFVLIEKYEGIIKRAQALNSLLRTGVPKEEALKLCGWPKDLKLDKIKNLLNAGNNKSQQN